MQDCAGLQVLRHGVALHQHEDVYIRKDGSFFPVIYSASPLVSGGKTIGLVVVFRDMTEPNRVYEQIRFQASLLDTVGQAAIATDPGGKIIYWNRFAESLYGWSKEEATGRTITDLVVAPPEVERATEVMKQLRAGHNWSGEMLVRRREGTVFPAFVTDTPIIDHHGVLQAIVGVSTDITERKRLEDNLRFLGDASATLGALVDY